MGHYKFLFWANICEKNFGAKSYWQTLDLCLLANVWVIYYWLQWKKVRYYHVPKMEFCPHPALEILELKTYWQPFLLSPHSCLSGLIMIAGQTIPSAIIKNFHFMANFVQIMVFELKPTGKLLIAGRVFLLIICLRQEIICSIFGSILKVLWQIWTTFTFLFGFSKCFANFNVRQLQIHLNVSWADCH